MSSPSRKVRDSGSSARVFPSGAEKIYSMTQKEGHFEKGRWVEEEEPAPETPSAPSAPSVDDLIDEASQSVRRAVGDVTALGRHLFLTEEGRGHLEKKARDAGAVLERAVTEVAEKARKSYEKKE